MIDRYRLWYEHECDSNDKMLCMIESVPYENRDDPRFQRVLALAGHLAACRENWLDRIVAGGQHQKDWWPSDVRLEGLRQRYEKMQETWTSFFSGLTEEDLRRDFEFVIQSGACYRWNVEGQIVQLYGHAFYHRGQIAMIIAELGGKPVDTDYLYWAIPRNPSYGQIA